MSDFGGDLDRYYAELEADYQARIDAEDREERMHEQVADEIMRDAHYVHDTLGENDNLTRALCEELVKLFEASQSKDPEAIKEPAYGVVRAMENMAKDYAPTVIKQEEREE